MSARASAEDIVSSINKPFKSRKILMNWNQFVAPRQSKEHLSESRVALNRVSEDFYIHTDVLEMGTV